MMCETIQQHVRPTPFFSIAPTPQVCYPSKPENPLPFPRQWLPFSPPSHPVLYQVVPEARLGTLLGKSLQLESIVGSGSYGTVYRAVDVVSKLQYAVKTLSKMNDDGTLKDQRDAASRTREVRLHWNASAHPNVASLHRIIEEPDCVHLVMEYCPQGDLFHNIVSCGRYEGDDELIRRTFAQILDAVEYCHARDIYHRDLKPENILVTDEGNSVRLADFGLASNTPFSEEKGCGSEFYMSPECLGRVDGSPYFMNAPNDVWSLGVILVNLTCRRNPWRQASSQDATYQRFMQDPTSFLQTILPVSDELNDILGMIFTPDPARRISLPELKQRILRCRRFTTLPPEPEQYDSDSCASIVSAVDVDDSDGDSDDAMSRCTTVDGLEPEDRPDVPERNAWSTPLPPRLVGRTDANLICSRLSCLESSVDCPSPVSVASDSTLVDDVFSTTVLSMAKGYDAVEAIIPLTTPSTPILDDITPHCPMPCYPQGQVQFHSMVPQNLPIPTCLVPSPAQSTLSHSAQPTFGCAAHVSEWWRHLQPNLHYPLPLFNTA